MDEDKILAAIAEGRRESRLAMDGLRAEVADLRAEVTSLRTEVTGLRAEVTGTRADMMDRFERVEHKLTLVSENMGVTMASASNSAQQRETDRKSVGLLTEMLHGLQRKLFRLQTDVEELQKRAH